MEREGECLAHQKIVKIEGVGRQAFLLHIVVHSQQSFVHRSFDLRFA